MEKPVPDPSTDKYSAGEQNLGYLYQSRLALLRLLELAENTAVLLEKDDDLDFEGNDGGKSLASLKHKAVGDRLTDLSTDFWKSVRIWLVRYQRDGRSGSNLRFFLFTTGRVADSSFLKGFLSGNTNNVPNVKTQAEQAEDALGRSTSILTTELKTEFAKLTVAEREDFFARVLIFDNSPRIENIPELLKERHLRSIRREHRDALFERLEGWWNDEVIKQLTGLRSSGIFGYEVSDKLAALSDEYKLNNLPITHRGKEPPGEIDTENDPRRFVAQLRQIGLSSNRIRNAILDYYRAFEQRSEWARENLLVSGEVEDYEERLIDEWSRYRDVVFESLEEGSAEEVLLTAGKELYLWADQESGNIESLRIRARVTEPYVTRGSFHILADATPVPRVYWHPRFLDRLGKVLEAGK